MANWISKLWGCGLATAVLLVPPLLLLALQVLYLQPLRLQHPVLILLDHLQFLSLLIVQSLNLLLQVMESLVLLSKDFSFFFQGLFGLQLP